MSDLSKTESTPPRGLVGDIHRARAGATATAGELREFVKQLRGRSPQEMLGIVAGSSLIQSTIVASIITVVFMAAFTVGPYYWKKMNPKPVVAAPKAAAAPPATPAAAPAGAAGAAAPPAAGTGGAPNSAMMTEPVRGGSEIKAGDPGLNPLDAKDDFFNTKALK